MNETIAGTYDGGQVTRATVALSDRRIALAEHRSHGAAHDVAASQYNGMAACDSHTSRVQELNDARGGAWIEERVGCPGGKVADIVCVESTSQNVRREAH